MFNPLAISSLLYDIENWTLKGQDKSLIKAAEITLLRKATKYTLSDHTKQIKVFLSNLRTLQVLVQVSNCHSNRIQHVSVMGRSRHVQAVMKYQPAGNGKTGRPLERHLDCNVETGTATRFKSLQAW
jgi:hypothetical protein